MVRGRRVRAVIAAYTPQDMDTGCCPPLQKIKKANRTKTINDFFCQQQTTQDSATEINNKSATVHSNDLATNIMPDISPSNGLVTDKQNDISTPKKQSSAQMNTTPHRIQLNLLESADKPKLVHQNTVADYFPIRRSVRKTTKTVQAEKQYKLEQALRHNLETGLSIHEFPDKGRGVIATQLFDRGAFVVEYAGDLIDPTEAKKRELMYSNDSSKGCYMYYFKHESKQYCIDATAESGRLGRLVNHSKTNANLCTKVVAIDNQPRLILVAKETIDVGRELLYDYGDRSKEALKHHPWLAN